MDAPFVKRSLYRPTKTWTWLWSPSGSSRSAHKKRIKLWLKYSCQLLRLRRSVESPKIATFIPLSGLRRSLGTWKFCNSTRIAASNRLLGVRTILIKIYSRWRKVMSQQWEINRNWRKTLKIKSGLSNRHSLCHHANSWMSTLTWSSLRTLKSTGRQGTQPLVMIQRHGVILKISKQASKCLTRE